MAAWLLVVGVGSASAQDDAATEVRVRALAAERLAPLLDLLARPADGEAPAGSAFAVSFAGDVQGLAVGAPVTIRGLRVGTVREITLTFDSTAGRLDVPVTIDIVPGSVVVDGRRPETDAEVRAAMATLVARGLRAQLASASILASQRQIALDIVPDAVPATLGDGPVPLIPTIPTRLEAMSATLERLLAELGALPVDRLAQQLESMLAAVKELVTAPELRQALIDLAGAAGELRATASDLAQRADPLIASLTRTADTAGPAAVETLANLTTLSAELRDLPARLEARSGPLLTSAVAATDEAGRAVVDARRTIAAVDATFGSRSTFQADLQALLREVTGATRALRQVLDLLQRQPDVLVRGRRDGPPP